MQRDIVSELPSQKSLHENHGNTCMPLTWSPCSSCLSEASRHSAKARVKLSSSPKQRMASSVAHIQEKPWDAEHFWDVVARFPSYFLFAPKCN